MNLNDIHDDDVSSDLVGQFYSKRDFEDISEIVVTIARVEKHSFEARNGRPAADKWCLFFINERAASLNKTNLQLMAKWFGKHARGWIGKTIVLYWDESVTYGGQLVGGMRIRKPSRPGTASAPTAEPEAVVSDMESDAF